MKHPEPETVGLSSSGLERVYQIIAQAVSAKKVLGASVLVAKRGVVLEPRSFGKMAFAQEALSCSEGTIFLIASITKPVTAAAVMLLVERGKLSLDDGVADIVPEFAKRG